MAVRYTLTYCLSEKIPLTIIMMLFSVAIPLVTITFLTSESSQTALNFYLFINIYNLLAGLSLAVFFPIFSSRHLQN